MGLGDLFDVQEKLDRAFLFTIDGQMDELGFEIRVHPVTLQETPSDGDGLHRVVDALRPHGHDLNTFTVADVIGDGSRYRGRIAFRGYFKGHYSHHERLLLPTLLKNIPSGFITWALGAVNQRPFRPSGGGVE